MPTPIPTALAGALMLSAAPAFAHDAEGLLAAPPAHARAGQCYAHVHKAARYAPPPVPGAHWRLSPPPPGSPGPVWCLTFDAASPPQLISLARDGWIRVRCGPPRVARVRHHRRVHAQRPPPPVYAVAPPPVGPCCLLAQAAGPPPPPVVILPAPRPYSPPSPAGRWLTWPGKRLY